MERFIEVAKVKDIQPGGAGLIHFGYQSIAIFNIGGAFYATDEYCTGDGGSLSEGDTHRHHDHMFRGQLYLLSPNG